jgi:CDP-diacylglycerol--glycerol-3-phosphate 3-phosphatidyltransferase
MKITTQFVLKHPDLFQWKKSDHIFPHDRLLGWTVLRLIPQRVTPNQVTGVRLLLTPIVVYLVAHGFYVAGAVAFLFVAFTDAIDGSLARTRNKITDFGTLLDPFADKILVGSLILLLVFQHFHYLLGVALLGLEIIFILTAVIARVRFHTVRGANLWGKLKMILQVIAMFVTLLAVVFNDPSLLSAAAWLFGLAIGFALMSLFSHGV